jgi:hypothetical protein
MAASLATSRVWIPKFRRAQAGGFAFHDGNWGTKRAGWPPFAKRSLQPCYSRIWSYPFIRRRIGFRQRWVGVVMYVSEGTRRRTGRFAAVAALVAPAPLSAPPIPPPDPFGRVERSVTEWKRDPDLPDVDRSSKISNFPCTTNPDGTTDRVVSVKKGDLVPGLDELRATIRVDLKSGTAQAIVVVDPNEKKQAEVVNGYLSHVTFSVERDSPTLRFPYQFDDEQKPLPSGTGALGETFTSTSPRWHYGDAKYARIRVTAGAQGGPALMLGTSAVDLRSGCEGSSRLARLPLEGYEKATRLLESKIQGRANSPYMSAWVGVQLSKAMNASATGNKEEAITSLWDAKWGANSFGDRAAGKQFHRLAVDVIKNQVQGDDLERVLNQLSVAQPFLGEANRIGVTSTEVKLNLGVSLSSVAD